MRQNWGRRGDPPIWKDCCKKVFQDDNLHNLQKVGVEQKIMIHYNNLQRELSRTTKCTKIDTLDALGEAMANNLDDQP